MNSEKITFHRITKELNRKTADFIKELIIEEFPVNYAKCMGKDMEDLSSFYSADGTLLVARLRNKIIGTVGCVHKDDYSVIVRLYVHKDYRKNGLATRLIEEILPHLNKGRVIYANVLNEMEAAIQLFKKFKFEFVPNVYDDHVQIGIRLPQQQ